MSEISIVLYEDKYRQRVFDFTDRCFRELGKAFDPAGRHCAYTDIPHCFKAFWCMLSHDDVVGTVAIKRLDSDTAELKALYLSSELRGQGLGSRLIHTAADYARSQGYRRIVLDSMSQYTAARRLYDKTGFVPIDRYNDNIYADVFMELTL
ncbi:MAG: GNAT family N-acetyltransferase [Oscillospiraceae bacterium]|nr:GNAT family N-acetyltransferase [Oscillospiraceae bacterium]